MFVRLYCAIFGHDWDGGVYEQRGSDTITFQCNRCGEIYYDYDDPWGKGGQIYSPEESDGK